MIRFSDKPGVAGRQRRCIHIRGHTTPHVPAMPAAGRRLAASPVLGSAAVVMSGSRCARKGGVDNVNTLGFGLGRLGAGLGRIGYVFGGVADFRGLECRSSPTSGTFSQITGPFGPLTVYEA